MAMKEAKFNLANTHFIQNKLEKEDFAASSAANDLNDQHQKVVVELIAQKATPAKMMQSDFPSNSDTAVRDINVVVNYDDELWRTQGCFLSEFIPLVQQHCQ
ncbi:hypothetical protein [Halochromatium glycolicum]|nr:hypothetical protein [Halochromatium glycolicum]